MRIVGCGSLSGLVYGRGAAKPFSALRSGAAVSTKYALRSESMYAPCNGCPASMLLEARACIRSVTGGGHAWCIEVCAAS